MQGYLLKRPTPEGPPPMQRVFCVLWGSLLLDFDSQEEAASGSLAPRAVCDVVGVAEWTGQGRSNQYSYGLQVLSSHEQSYYMSASSAQERDDWFAHLRAAVEVNNLNTSVTPFRPGRLLQGQPVPAGNSTCPSSGAAVGPGSPLCPSCGRAFVSAELLAWPVVLHALGEESTRRCCSDCRLAESVVLWLKLVNYGNLGTLHLQGSALITQPQRYKYTCRLLARSAPTSTSTDVVGATVAEDEILLQEISRRRRIQISEATLLDSSLESIGDDMPSLLSILLSPSVSERGGRLAYIQILRRVLVLADARPRIVDFYWPQLIQVHLIESAGGALSHGSQARVDLLQQMLLAIAQRYPVLATKLAWSLLATMDDFRERRGSVSQAQFAAAAALLMQLDMLQSGAVSAIADVPESRVLASFLRVAEHHRQELGYELSVLCLARGQLQEILSNLSPVQSTSEEESLSKSCQSLTCMSAFQAIGVGCGGACGIRRRYSIDESDEEDKSVGNDMPEGWMGLSRQLDFYQYLTDVVESLRFIDRPQRLSVFKDEMRSIKISSVINYKDLVGTPKSGIYQCWLASPSYAGEPLYSISEIYLDECRVFRTKARAPTMLVCQVTRDDSCMTTNPLLGSIKRERGDLSNGVTTSPLKNNFKTTAGELIDEAELEGLVSGGIDQLLVGNNRNKPEAEEANDSLSQEDNGALRPARVPTASSKQQKRASLFSSSRNMSTFYSNLQSASSNAELNDVSVYLSGVRIAAPATSLPPANDPIAESLDEDEEGVMAPVYDESSVLGNQREESSPPVDLICYDYEVTKWVTVSKKIFSMAQKMLNQGTVDIKEYNQIILADAAHWEAWNKDISDHTRSQIETAYGESWESKRNRLLQKSSRDSSSLGLGGFDLIDWPRLNLVCFIVKSNDDLRQEICCLQLMQMCSSIFDDAGLSGMLWLRPYQIVSTGATTGLVEVVTDSISLDGLKKTQGFKTLAHFFSSTFDASSDQLDHAKRNFAASLAAYSLFSYIFAIKDRHNGNILLDKDGHIIHIDFGFILSIAPGGTFSLETAPFKLTKEYADVLDGLGSPYFSFFVRAFTLGFLALRAHSSSLLSFLQLSSMQSPYPCFAGRDPMSVVEKLSERLRPDLTPVACVRHCLELIGSSYSAAGTRRYDAFQWMSNGIYP